MKKFFISCSLPAILFAMVACSEHCNGFPEELTDYLPYKQGQIITFVNEHNDTLSMQVDTTWRTKPYNIKFGCKCVCEAFYGFNFSVIDNVDYFQKISCSMVTGDNNYLQLFLKFSPISSDIIFSISEMIDKINIVNHDESDPINNIEIVKRKGITSFTDKNLNCTWILSEN